MTRLLSKLSLDALSFMSGLGNELVDSQLLDDKRSFVIGRTPPP